MKVILAIALTGAATVAGAADLVVHEWGTFTSFQDANGTTIAGINVDDEPVPKFVHRLGDLPIFTPQSIPATWSQGAPRCHPDVTLRLETPVLYFYPQPSFPEEQALDVSVSFNGGWLTEFFPFAAAERSSFPGPLKQTTRGSLRWSRLQLTADAASMIPQTGEQVWLAPRQVQATVVFDKERQEAEKYLFYRGVGHIDAPIVIRQQGETLAISLRDGQKFLTQLPPIWIVRVEPDGRVRYRRVSATTASITESIPAAGTTSASDLDALRRELAQALMSEGLFQDEAQAMLATWKLSYFDSEGLRVFFVLPHSWTDAHLPLAISVPADITRVMLGRVEIVSSHQRQALRRLLALPEAAFDLQPIYHESEAVRRRLDDGTSHADFYRMLGREVPEALQLYDSLGRFRDALLAHEWRTGTDEAQRQRIERIVALFGSCVPDFPAAR